MTERFNHHSQAWVTFSYGSFLVACVMVAAGIAILPIEIWSKGYLLMGMAMLVQTAINVTKTIRDNHESQSLHRRLEDARTEKLLKETDSAGELV